ncbi:MAG: hypothetical protein JXN60_05950 [Lentisphaerae bacterium]|nr:hypothetical protein [Lentisphaerota bacterium]
MTHSVFHFAIGMALGTSSLLPWILHRILKGRSANPLIITWLFLAYGLGAWAVVPNMLRQFGVGIFSTAQSWVNIFLLHSFLDSRQLGGALIGAACVIVCFSIQYGIILFAIYRRRVITSPSPTN